MHKKISKKLASRGDRFIAFILDSVLFFIILIPTMILIGIAEESENDNLDNAAMLLRIGSIITYIVWSIYLLVYRSQTPGKYIMNLQVVDHDTQKRIGFCASKRCNAGRACSG
jgi:uncharacterized RDD family membrane protein YckC